MQLDKLNILYVDDDADDRQFFAEAIKETGIAYKLSTAVNAMEALELMKAGNRFDVVFMDINMPLMDGKECLRQIKTNENTRDTTVIMLSVTKSEKETEEVYKSGAHYHIVKPYSLINFINSLKIVFAIDWKKKQPIPEKSRFIINLSLKN